jgi:IclR family mhp operon transcriptional activator
MLETLEHAGYVMRRDGGKRYMPTGRVLLLANGFQAHERVAQLAEPVLAALRERIGWPSDVAIPDRDAMMIAATSRAFDNLLLNRRSGARAPMLASAIGRAYLAACAAPRREEILVRLERSPEPFDRIAADRPAVERLVDDIRARGYAVPDDTYSKAVYQSATSGFAVAVLVSGAPVGSINLMFLTSTIGLQDAVASFLPALRSAAAQIGTAMEGDLDTHAPDGMR